MTAETNYDLMRLLVTRYALPILAFILLVLAVLTSSFTALLLAVALIAIWKWRDHSGNLRRRIGPGLLSLLLLALLGAFLVWPILLTVRGGLVASDGSWTFDHIRAIFADPLSRAGLVNAFWIAICTTLLSLLIALPLAVMAVRFDYPFKPFLNSLIMVPLILPPFVGAIGMRAMLGRFGAVNTVLIKLGVLAPGEPGIDFLGGAIGGQFVGVVVMEALHLYPILFLNLTAALANLDPTLDEAAQNLGADRWRRFTRVTLPLIAPGIFAGGTIVLIWSFTELGTPLMFDYYTVTPVQIFWGIQEIHSDPKPYALTVVMLAAAVGLYAVGRFAFGGRAYAMSSKSTIAWQARPLPGWRGWIVSSVVMLMILVAILPHLGVVFSSFSEEGAWYQSVLPQDWTLRHYHTALTHPLAAISIRNSLMLALAATVVCVVVGVAIAYLSIRLKAPGSSILDTLAMLPLAVPGLVMAFGYVAMTLDWPFAGGPLASIGVLGADPNPMPLLVVAYAVRRLPYVLRSAAAGLEQTSHSLEEASLNLGASTLTTLRRVTMPLIAANLIAGAILAFSFAMLEVSDSLVLAQKTEHYPITKAIFDFFSRLGDGPYIASAMGVWGMALLTVTLVGAGMMLGRRLGAIFRV